LVGSHHVRGAMSLEILVNASVLISGAGRLGAIFHNGLLKFWGVMIVLVGHLRETQGRVNSASGQRVGSLRETGQILVTGG